MNDRTVVQDKMVHALRGLKCKKQLSILEGISQIRETKHSTDFTINITV